MADPARLRLAPESPDPAGMERAVACLRAGDLLVYPTDTLYALGGVALRPGVAERVRAAKGREAAKPLPLVAGDREQAGALVEEWSETAELLARRFWPGPLTLVARAASGLPAAVTAGGTTVAIRVPGLALTRALCLGAGPLLSTSANRSGEAPALSCEAALRAVGEAVSLALDVGPLVSAPSTLVDVSGERARLIREGAIAWREIVVVLRGGHAPLE